MCAMSRAEIVSAGGFWVYLKQQQGVVIPPGYIIMSINRGGMLVPDEAADCDIAEAAVDLLVS